jgi:hypothetical protein
MTPLDHATRQWLREGQVRVSEWGAAQDNWALLDAVNRCRALGDLPPLDPPDHWPNREGEYP